MNKLIHKILSFKKWKLILSCLMGIFLLISFIALQRAENKIKINAIEIDIYPKSEIHFLDSLSIMQNISQTAASNAIIGTKLEELQIHSMEQSLEQNPFVEQADITLHYSGKLVLKIKQRIPLFRVINKEGESYYVAKNGYKIPTNASYTPRVLIANGNIAERLIDSAFIKTKIVDEIYKISSFCAEDNFWNAQIEQIYVDNYNDIILIPMVGNHKIVFGSAENLEKKFANLKTFYMQGLNKIGWTDYKTINLKYANQIITEKKDNITNTK